MEAKEKRSNDRKPMAHWMSDQWPLLTIYQRIECVVAFVLTLIITAVIFVALFRLAVGVTGGLVLGALNPLNHRVFQEVFGEILTVLIAMEFNHTLQYVVTREQSIIQIKTVLLISLLAMARKFIILDINEVSALELTGLAAVTIALGATYWLLRSHDARNLQ